MKKKGGKEIVSNQEASEWTPPMKGEDLESFNKVRAALVKGKKLKSLSGLQDRLDKAGKKGASAELDRFISENGLLLEVDPAVEVQVTVDVAVKVGQEGVDKVVQAGGEHEDVKEASNAATKLVEQTALLAEQAKLGAKLVEAPTPAAEDMNKEPLGKAEFELKLLGIEPREVLERINRKGEELYKLMYSDIDKGRQNNEINTEAWMEYAEHTFKNFKLRGSKIADALSKLPRVKDPGERAKKAQELVLQAEEWEKEAEKVEEFLDTNPFLRADVAVKKAVERKERFKDAMAWLKDRGHGLAEKAKDLKIEHHVRALGERYNKLPRKYKYATSIALALGGASAGFVGGSVGAAALGLIGAGRLGYRAIGAAAAFVSIEAGLQTRKEKKETIFNRHPKAVATGIAALILIGAPGMIFRELGGVALEHAGLGNASAPHPLEAIHKGDFEDSGYESKTPGLIHKGDFEDSGYGPKPLEQIHNGGFENSEWSGNGIIEIHQGGNAWNAIKDYLQENKLVEGLSQGQKDYVIASIEKRVNEMSDADFAKTGFSTRDIGLVYENQKIDLSQILADKNEMNEILERAGHLGAATPPEGVAVAETASEVPGTEEAHAAADAAETETKKVPTWKRPEHGFYAEEHAETPNRTPTWKRPAHGFYAEKNGVANVDSVSHSAAENLAEHGEISKDPAVLLWELHHPGENAPKSLLREAMELRAHGVPIEANPLFTEEALTRVDTHMKFIFGDAGIKSDQWNAFKEYSASHVLKLPQTGYAGESTANLQDYLKQLIKKTGLEPMSRGGRLETLEHFVIRAEAASLKIDLGGGSSIDMNYASGLYENVEPDNMSGETRVPRYVPPESASEMAPQYRPPTYSNYGYVPEHRPPYFSNYGYAPQHRPGSYYGRGHGRGPILRNLLPPFKQWWNPFSGHK